MEIKFIYDRWDHHSGHSGYDIMVPFLGEPLPSIDYKDKKARIVPWRVATRFVHHRVGMRHYAHHHFYAELTAVFDMFKSKNTIYHVMEGDFGYRHLGKFSGFKGNRVVATYHLPPKRLADDIHSFKHLDQLSAIFVVGKNQLSFFEPHVQPDKLHWVPLGIDTEYFHPVPSRQRSGTKQCLFVGRHMRDLETLKGVVERLAADDELDVKTVLVTDQAGKEMFAGIQGVDARVRIPEEELLDLYQQSDLLLLPLFDATAVIALLESLACGLPIVSTNIGAVPDYVDDTCAKLAPPQDPEAMYAAVRTLLTDEQRLCEMSENARQKALKYDWSEIVRIMRDIYSQIL
ncbi:MAG: glycosyltransferase [Chloroflexi bacterium]|nr:MAG: glycosyltransferase [Chloroflexota bacterium]